MSIRCLAVALLLSGTLPAADLTAELLQEIRLLRAAVERVSALGTRAQITIQRMQGNDRRIGQLTAQLDAARKEVGGLQAEQAHAVELMNRSAAEKDRPETTPAKRTALDNDIEQYKRRAEGLSQREAQARVRESQIQGDLNLERSQQSEDIRRLEEIDRALSSPAKP